MQHGFDSDKYKDIQKRELLARAKQQVNDRLYVEVGGKIIDDLHSTRVLPGYRKDLKLEIINEVFPNAEFVCGVSAKDIDRGRQRGDFFISYDQEVFRLIDGLKKRKQKINKLIITRVDANNPSKHVQSLEREAIRRGLEVYKIYENQNYKPDKKLLKGLDDAPKIDFKSKEIIITAPGAGSGKFGICLTQLYHEMKDGKMPQYLKMETYPVHNMPISHPLNCAYVAAAADVGDKVVSDENDPSSTSYNRDLDNFALLEFIVSLFENQADCLREYTSATSMGVNFVKDGIINDDLVQRESAAEVARRFMRYKYEYLSKKEKKETVLTLRRLLHKMMEDIENIDG